MRSLAVVLSFVFLLAACDSGTPQQGKEVHVSASGEVDIQLLSDGSEVASISGEIDNLRRQDVPSDLTSATVVVDTTSFKSLGAVQAWSDGKAIDNIPYHSNEWQLDGAEYRAMLSW